MKEEKELNIAIALHNNAGVSPETTVDLDHIHHTNTTTKHQQDHLPALIKQPGKPKTGNTSR